MNRKMKIICVLALGVAVFLWNAGNAKDTENALQQGIAKKILRFHVMANSDSREDQKVKEEVRNAIGAYLEPKLSDVAGLEETKEVVAENMEGIVQVAQNTLEQNGFSYGATAMLTRTQFPEKTYGSYTFPKGEYEALEVELGKGEGHNWWCVLYPNMCFRGSVYEVVDEAAGEALREVLTVEEYEDVFEGGHFQVRFKFLEYFR